MLRQPLVALLLVFTLSGCSVLGYADPKFALPAKRAKAMKLSTDAFATNLRWGRYSEAGAFVEPDKRMEFLKMVRNPNSSIRFTDYEVVAVEMSDEEVTEATALVNFRLHRLPSMREVYFQDEQTWKYDAGDRKWYVDPDLTAYGDAGKPVASAP